MKKQAIDNVKEHVDYSRPFFDFPDLDSEDGNTTVFWKKAHSTLSRQGFKKEAEYMNNKFYKMHYNDLFDYLNKFLNFEPKEEIINEDEDSIYIKISKNKIDYNQDIKQPLLFNINNLETIKSLYEAGEDFSITNCYGRNIFHYVQNIDVLNFLLEQNKKDNFIDLLDLDYFNSPVLKAHKDPNIFIALLNEMHLQNPILTDILLHGTDVFNENALGVYLEALDNKFSNKQMNELNEKDWKDFTIQLKTLNNINEDLTKKLISSLDNLPIFQKKENKDIKDNAFYQFMQELIEKKNNSTKKVKKI